VRIVFVGNGTIWTDTYPKPNVGGSVQTWFLSKELSRRGHEVFIIRRSRIKEVTVDNVNLLGINFKSIDEWIQPFCYLWHLGALTSKFLFSKKSLKIIKRVNPDVICFIDRFTGVFQLYLEVPKIYIMHVPEALDFFKPYAIRFNKLNSIMFYVKKIVESRVLRNVDEIVTLNSFIERYLMRIGYNNICRIPNGIDIEHFSNKGDGDFILYAGRFDWNKNVCSLVNVFSQIHKSYSDYHLYLVGAGQEERKIRKIVKEKKIQSHVKFFPWVPREKLMELMSRCSVFVLPSFFEAGGPPVVVLEAMASAKPVIARANMGTVDIINHGKNGYLYSKDEELQKYLEMLLSDRNLRKRIGRNARRIVEQEYTFSRIADKYEALFQTLLG